MLKPDIWGTWYIDTENFELKSKNFFRVRKEEENKKNNLTLC